MVRGTVAIVVLRSVHGGWHDAANGSAVTSRIRIAATLAEILETAPCVMLKMLRQLKEWKQRVKRGGGSPVDNPTHHLEREESVRATNCFISRPVDTHNFILILDYYFNPLKPELNPIRYLLALLGAHHFLHVSRIRVKSLTLRLLMSYIYIWSTHS